MKALLFSIGTRGDVEPFLALAEILKKHDWEVICVFPEQFRSMAEEMGLTFHGFDKRFLELLEQSSGRAVMDGSGGFIERSKALIKLSRSSWKLQGQLLETQRTLLTKYQADRVIYHPKCVYPVVWEILNPGNTLLICPIPCIFHEVREFTVMGLKGNGDYGRFINQLSYKVANWVRSMVFFRMVKPMIKNSVKRITRRAIHQTMVHRTRTIYSISPSLFPRPAYWPEHLFVSGFVERTKSSHWDPPHELQNFISRYPKALFVTFGSMTNKRPEKKTELFLEVLKKHQIPAIINTSWGGLVDLEQHPNHVLFVKNIPYDWVLPKMYAVVHHGGSGTTHTACKYGCPSLVIPHIVDQFFWNKRIAALGLGPRGVSINKLSPATLEPLLLDLWHNEQYKLKAGQLSFSMSTEGRPEQLTQLIESQGGISA